MVFKPGAIANEHKPYVSQWGKDPAFESAAPVAGQWVVDQMPADLPAAVAAMRSRAAQPPMAQARITVAGAAAQARVWSSGVAPMPPPQQASWPVDFNPQLNWLPALIANQLPAGTVVAPVLL